MKSYFRFFSNYLGEIEDKKEVLSKYKYSIVIENSSDYLSEKLFLIARLIAAALIICGRAPMIVIIFFIYNKFLSA